MYLISNGHVELLNKVLSYIVDSLGDPAVFSLSLSFLSLSFSLSSLFLSFSLAFSVLTSQTERCQVESLNSAQQLL